MMATRYGGFTGRRSRGYIWWPYMPGGRGRCWQRPRRAAKRALAGVKAALAVLPRRVLAGRVVTGDALLAQRALCRQIIAQKGAISSSSRTTSP